MGIPRYRFWSTAPIGCVAKDSNETGMLFRAQQSLEQAPISGQATLLSDLLFRQSLRHASGCSDPSRSRHAPRVNERDRT